MTRRVGRYHKNFSRAQRDMSSGAPLPDAQQAQAESPEGENGGETHGAKAKKKVSQVKRLRSRTPKSSRRRLRRG